MALTEEEASRFCALCYAANISPERCVRWTFRLTAEEEVKNGEDAVRWCLADTRRIDHLAAWEYADHQRKLVFPWPKEDASPESHEG